MRRSPPSVRARLTAWYAITMFTTFVVAVIGLRAALASAMAENFHDSLTASGRLITTFFRIETVEYESVYATVAHMNSELVFPERQVEFLPPNDDPRYPLEPPVARPPLLAPRHSVVLALDPELAPGWRVRITAGAQRDAALLRRMDLWFSGLIAMSVIVASLGGWWLAGRALQPVRSMADAAELITARHHSGRLPVSDTGDEFTRLGERFNALLDRLDGALVQQRRFLAEAAHELRTPIARTRGQVELALDTRAGATDQRATLEQVRDGLADTGRLVDELLELARADAGGMEAHLLPNFLDDVVVEALGRWRADAERRGVRLELLEVEETPVLLDPLLIRRLVGILVHNALKYTPPGGTVRARIRSMDGFAELDIEDTGIGMSEEELAHAFERFHRGTRARELFPDGSGLGLSIAQWVAAQHSASISLQSGAEGGTRVLVRFPLHPRPQLTAD